MVLTGCKLGVNRVLLVY